MLIFSADNKRINKNNATKLKIMALFFEKIVIKNCHSTCIPERLSFNLWVFFFIYLQHV